jgi:hypothetical protein
MASTYSPLKIELMGTGDQSGTWGTTTNTNLGTAIEEAITGSADVSFSSADVTLTLTNTNTAQTARNLRLNLTGTVAAAQNLIVPSIEKQYIINNTLGFDITVKNSTGTGVAVPAGKSVIVFNNGTNVVDAISALGASTILPVINGGTGVATSTGTGNTVLSASPTLTGTPLAPTAAPGTNTTQIATTAFVTATTSTLGTMSTQNANAVAITGGTVSGSTITATTKFLAGDGSAAVPSIAFSSDGSQNTGLYWSGEGIIGITNDGVASGSISAGGNLVMVGNVTAFSDERLKKNWTELDSSYISRLAQVKNGTYERIDNNLKQVGVSAQSLQEILPEAVMTNEDGILSVAYGNAALVSTVKLAQEVMVLKELVKELSAEVEHLKATQSKHIG